MPAETDADIMYVIERVSGLIFKKDGEHQSYQLKSWSHNRKEEAMKAFLEPETPAACSAEAGPSNPKEEKSSGNKLRQMLRDMFSMCKYSATQAYEARKDMNRLLNHAGLSSQPLVPPATFPLFPDSSSGKEEEHREATDDDDEPLSAKIRRFRGPKIAIRKTLRTPKPHGKSPAAEDDDDEEETEAEEEKSWSSE